MRSTLKQTTITTLDDARIEARACAASLAAIR